MKLSVVCFAGIGLLCIAEGFSAWWMGSRPVDPRLPILEWNPPFGQGWTSLPDEYEEVDDALLCTSGWIGQIESTGRPVRISFFRWDQTRTVSTLEAFDHMPEQCMGSTGMELQQRFEPRILEIDGRPIRFDVTCFRPENGLGMVYIFKAIIVSGHDNVGLRSGLEGIPREELRSFRLAATWKRFRPPHTRVLMGGISGVPTEALAWREFRDLIRPQLRWTTHGELTAGSKGGRS